LLLIQILPIGGRILATPAEHTQRIEISEETLLEQGRRIRALHEIISRPDLNFDQQIDETLRLGCQLFGTEIGKVGRQDPHNNTSEFLNTIVMSDLPARRGIVLPLDKTFCQVTFSSPQTIAISHVAESEYKDHPAAQYLGMQSYIGCTIQVHGNKFGTVNFSNREPVKHPFTEADKDLVNLIGSWISVMMERQLEAEELKRSKEAADAANQAKSAFLAHMSHEIRTPLTSIIGFAETALDEDTTEEQRIDALRTISQSGNHLLHLINDVLDFSAIEAGELHIDKSTMNPLQLVAEVESMVAGLAKRKHLDFAVDYAFPLPHTIIADSLRLKQVLLNLCSNAIKFTDQGEVRIALRYDVDQDELTLEVKDTGIGMTAEQIAKLFRPFKQADTSVSRRFGGTGLGLCLSKRLAELMGSHITVASEPGVGTGFSLIMQQVRGNDDPSGLINSEDDIGRWNKEQYTETPVEMLRGEVLLAEDNLMNQQLIQRYLQKMGATVTVAENGAVAAHLARQHRYDLVYMDMQMPVLSGLDAVRALRDSDYTGPIVMLTANATSEDRKRCKEAGSDDFLTKPIDRRRLYEMTREFLNPA
jgi:signal transduction histidine kinase/CheY-like chemotaxis protein